MSFGIFAKKPESKSSSYGAAPKARPASTSAKSASTHAVRVGWLVRGADEVPPSYKTVNEDFFGEVLSVDGDSVRVKCEETDKIFKVDAKYLVRVDDYGEDYY